MIVGLGPVLQRWCMNLIVAPTPRTGDVLTDELLEDPASWVTIDSVGDVVAARVVDEGLGRRLSRGLGCVQTRTSTLRDSR